MRPIYSALLLTTAMIAPAVCHAVPVDLFTLTAPGQVSVFTIAATPTAIPNGPNDFVVNGISTTTNGVTTTTAYDFYTTFFGGGFTNLTSIPTQDYFGTQLFSGTTTNPTFISGVYSLSSMAAGDIPDSTLTISGPTGTAVTPEPSSFILLGTGAIGAFAAFRRRITA